MNAHQRELGDKIPFSGALFGWFQLGVLVGCVPGHGSAVKTVLVGFLSWSSYHLITKTSTGDFVGDMAIGSVILMQFLVALDTLFFTDPNSLKNHHESNAAHQGKITDRPLSERVRWAFNLYISNRGVGWAHEPRFLPKRPPAGTPRWKFVSDRLMTAVLGFALESMAVVVNSSNPGLTTPGRTLSEAPFIWRFLAAAGFALSGRARINALHCILSAVVVGLGLSQPERWPKLFGSFLDAWSIQNVWRVVWHQMLRKPLIGCTDFILTKVLHLRPLSHKTNNKVLDTAKWLLWLYILFFVVGVIHLGGEYMLLGKLGLGALKFFSLQAFGITIEKTVAFISNWLRLSSSPKSNAQRLLRTTMTPNGSPAEAKTNTNGLHTSKSLASGARTNHTENNNNNNNSNPRIWVRLIGYIWVMCWFTWTLAFNLEPMVSTGMFVNSRLDLRKNDWRTVVSHYSMLS